MSEVCDALVMQFRKRQVRYLVDNGRTIRERSVKGEAYRTTESDSVQISREESKKMERMAQEMKSINT